MSEDAAVAKLERDCSAHFKGKSEAKLWLEQ